MTEEEWAGCTDLARMVDFAQKTVSDRKFRLYLCGGCRHIAHLFFDSASSEAVEVAERFADGQADKDELHWAGYNAECPTFGYDFQPSWWREHPERKREVVPRLVAMGALPASALSSNQWEINESIASRLRTAACLAEFCASCSYDHDGGWRPAGYIAQEPAWPGRWLFDCVFGNPFRSSTINAAWIGATSLMLATSIYTERAFDRLPILADALEEAGCTDADILAHCRGPGPHVRGCWVVDLLLGKS